MKQDPSKIKKSDSSGLKIEAAGVTGIQLVRVSTYIYVAMALAGIELTYWFHKSLPQIFALPTQAKEWGESLGLSFGICMVLLLFSYGLECFESYAKEREALAKAIGKMGVGTSLYLALLSAVGEELLFRAGLQPFTGVIIASLAFGLLHLSPNGGVSLWTAWTFVAGLLLGSLFAATHSIWPCILAHFLVNAFSFLQLHQLRKSIKVGSS